MAPPCGGMVLPVIPAALRAAVLAMAMCPSMRSRNAGWPAGDLVQILPGGQRLVGPQRVVPVAAGEPVAGRRGVGEGLDFGQHVGERFHAGQVDIELGAPGPAEMGVRVIEAGKDKRAALGGSRSSRRVLGPARRVTSSLLADGQHFSAADGHGLHCLGLIALQPHAGVDHAIEKDDVGHNSGKWRRHPRPRRWMAKLGCLRCGSLARRKGSQGRGQPRTEQMKRLKSRDPHARSLAEAGTFSPKGSITKRCR